MALPRKKSLPGQAVRRQPCCSRCGGGGIDPGDCPLRAHHVIALADGGADELYNMDVLCQECHREWHMMERRGGPSYKEWLDTMPNRIFSRIQLMPELHMVGWLGVRRAFEIMKQAGLEMARERAAEFQETGK